MSLFSDAELRVLKYGDRALVGPGRGYQKGRNNTPGQLGNLTEAEAMRMVSNGMSTADLAALAGVQPQRVSKWKAAHGIARPKRADGAA